MRFCAASFSPRKRHGAREGPVGIEIALGREIAEHEAQPRDLLGGAERRRQRGQRSIRHLDRNGGAILDLDRVHARRDPGIDAGQRAIDVGQHIVGVDRLRQADAAELARPFCPRQGTV